MTMLGLIGKKLGMTQIFTSEGEPVAVTIVEALPATVLAVKTKEKDGYQAIQVSAGSVRKEKHLTKPELGRFLKAGDAVRLWIEEIGEFSHTLA